MYHIHSILSLILFWDIVFGLILLIEYYSVPSRVHIVQGNELVDFLNVRFPYNGDVEYHA